MKRAMMWLCLLALLVAFGRMAVAPPHYLIVYPEQVSDQAMLSVNGADRRPMRGFVGFYFARIDVIEGGAVVEVFQSSRPVAHCNLGYFTSFDMQPNVVMGDECVEWDGRDIDLTG
jgi:hypothetical protein